MTTRARSAPKLRARWHNPSTLPRVTLARDVRGQTLERQVGPRGRLTLDEAAAVLQRPASEVRKDIRTGFLRARRDRGQLVVTVAACHRFLLEARADGQASRAALEEMRRTGGRGTPASEVFRRHGLERSLLTHAVLR